MSSRRRRIVLAVLGVGALPVGAWSQVLYSEDFNDGLAASRWSTVSSSDFGTVDVLTNFNLDYSTLEIPAAPGGTGTRGLQLDVNRTNEGVFSEAEGLNAYPNSQDFSGDFVLRFAMWGRVVGAAGTTEDSVYGINASGTRANWFTFGGTGTDGYFYSNTMDGGTGGNNDYIAYLGLTGSDPIALALYDNLDPLPQATFPANPLDPLDGGGAPSNRWTTVDVGIAGGRISMRYNGVLFDTYESSLFANGNVFLGHQDLFNSVNTDSFSIYDNLRVLRINRWASDFDGAWDTGTNWVTGAAPNGVDAIAYLGPNISGPRGVVFGATKTLGDLIIRSEQFYNVAGAGPLVMDSSFGSTLIEVQAGAGHRLSLPVSFNDPGAIRITDAAADLTIAGGVSFNAVRLAKGGPGRLNVQNLRGGSLAIEGGTLQVTASGGVGAPGAAGASKVSSLSLAAGAATLDITDNLVVVDSAGPAGYAAIKAAILSARNGGAWDGAGITSSLLPAAAATRGVGYARAADLGGAGALLGQLFGADAVLVRYTLLGDANLSGTVDIDDFGALAASFNLSADWGKGDFNYSGITDIDDFGILAAAFNRSLPSDGARVAVPEPTISMCCLPLLGLRRFRRTRR